MKLSRLPEIDLARIAPLDPARRERQLKAHKGGGGSWSYDPARDGTTDAFGPENPLGLRMPPLTWQQHSKNIKRRCDKGVDQVRSNLGVAKPLFDMIRSRGIRSVEFNFPALALGRVDQVRYWQNLIFEMDGERCVAFFNHRRDPGFGTHGKRFAFSVMHHQIRVMHPDFADYRLVIFEFPEDDESEEDDARTICWETDKGYEFYTLDQLDEMVSGTYAQWRDVCLGRRTSATKEDEADEAPILTFIRKAGGS